VNGWVELRCARSLKGKLHVEARIIEIACHQGSKTRHGTHAFDWFDADTGRRMHYLEVRFRLVRYRITTMAA
jgi:hypothetical protein